jgi:hypothetical protein
MSTGGSIPVSVEASGGARALQLAAALPASPVLDASGALICSTALVNRPLPNKISALAAYGRQNGSRFSMGQYTRNEGDGR